MKNIIFRCPKCGSKLVERHPNRNAGYGYLQCIDCEYKWTLQKSVEEYNTLHYPLELNEHAQYLKDGTKLTKQDKYDLQIDLWQYGKR